MKKFMLMVLCVVMTLPLVLSGCGQSGAGSQDQTTSQAAAGSTQAAAEDTSVVTPGGTFPIVKPGNNITLSIFTCTRPGCDDFVNNSYTKLVEDTMGIKLTFDVAEENESRQKLNVLIASGDYPDIVSGWLKPSTFTLAEQAAYAKQGILIPLNDMIGKYGVGYKKMLELYPAISDQFMLEDGKTYTMPSVNECFHCLYSTKMWIYKPWLDKLGLKEPTTTDEFYNVLKAFKTQDPNGNGKADEIPLTGSIDGWNTQPHKFLMNSFIYTDPNSGYFFVKDGKVTAAFDKPEWKEGLKFMKKLVSEGLLATESYTQKDDQLKLQTINGTVGSVPAGWPGDFGDYEKSDGDWTKYSIMAPLKGPAGEQHAWYNAYGVANAMSFITDKCKYPEVAFRFLDSFYINDGSNPISLKLYYGGEEGVAWTKAKDGDVGVDGQPAKWTKTEAGMATEPKNTWWDEMQPMLRTDSLRVQWTQSPGVNPMESILYLGSKKMEPFKPDVNMVLPPLVFNEADSAEVGELKTTIQTYVEETLTKMVVSDVDIDKEWDKYISELDKMNLNRYLEIYQTAYDKKVKK